PPVLASRDSGDRLPWRGSARRERSGTHFGRSHVGAGARIHATTGAEPSGHALGGQRLHACFALPSGAGNDARTGSGAEGSALALRERESHAAARQIGDRSQALGHRQGRRRSRAVAGGAFSRPRTGVRRRRHHRHGRVPYPSGIGRNKLLGGPPVRGRGSSFPVTAGGAGMARAARPTRRCAMTAPQPLDLAVIGNGRTAALVDTKGRMVWWCFPRFDSDPIFCRLIAGDEEKGFFDVLLEGFSHSQSRYDRNTATVETLLTAKDGAAIRITDFAPRFRNFDRTLRPPQLMRRIEPAAGMPRITIRLRPTQNYGKPMSRRVAG